MRASGLCPLLAIGVVLVAPAATPSLSSSLEDITPADALMRLWPGVRDTSEQIVVSPDELHSAFDDDEPVRVRTVVTRVQLPWLGPRVLYLEEFLHDQPSVLRRQLLLRVETETVGPRRARVFPYTFKDGERWRRLNLSSTLVSELKASDVEATQGCDLVLNQEGDQFRGGTTGLDCGEESRGVSLYVDYRLVIGTDVYWYRRRLMRESDDRLHEEVIGYNWFSPNDTRLFTCRVEYSASGRLSELRPILRLDVHDQGGHARFTTPDGRKFDLSLHTEDWPFASDRDALLLLLEQPDDPDPVASAWTDPDARQIAIELGWLNVRCGPLVPETGEVAS
ncbi:MAG: CpcT/CpeT family chromophore lyase [Gammaproteobacteria bacterium]